MDSPSYTLLEPILQGETRVRSLLGGGGGVYTVQALVEVIESFGPYINRHHR